ncbi:RHS repeat-associated core domain-containing protein [Aestuariibacter sp. AA17]|uniref:RHS repeat-associated core domain-containing protein n=1 Tax=Fluctibacter corallii TaxID=2984329 RepID=A0ABT3AAQ0_9ALTE|nr:RHS repeat-associated core domain-containing protein [Aestuariibacter sp. AA17]
MPKAGSNQHYRAFGASIEGEVDDIGYTGHKFDTDIGLSYMQARYYDPVIGRFYSNDPVDVLEHMQRGNPVHGFNRYTYANNNPYIYVDPDGKYGINPANIQQQKWLRNDPIGKGVSKAVQQVSGLAPGLGDMIAVGEAIAEVANGDVPIDNAASAGASKGAEALTDNAMEDFSPSENPKKDLIKAVVKTVVGAVAGDLVDTGVEDIDKLANKEIDQSQEFKDDEQR